MVLRRLSVALLAVAAVSSAGAARWGWKEGRTIGGPGYALPNKQQIIVPVAADDVLLAAAFDLAQAIEIRHGRSVQVVHSDWRRPRYSIFLGAVPSAKSAFHVPEDLEGDGYVIHWRGSRVFIDGRTTEGAVNGAYALAGRELGARWYWPGSIGFELASPVQRDGLPARFEQAAPAFLMRWLHPLRNEGETAFGRRNRVVRNHSFNHALYRVFDREVFVRNPEAFALVGGERREPEVSGRFDPNPDFTSDAAVDVAARAALQYFETNPASTTFSLSVNDNVLYDESEATREAVSPLRYFRDRPVYTDLVFGFMNRVAERVFDEAGMWSTPAGEPRFLTALAYYWTEAAPTIDLHPRVLPVLTSDRAQWHDPAYRAEDRDLIATWSRSGASRIGTWDYYFGSPYPYPRQFNRWIGESLPHLHAHGVRVFFSQLPSAWGLDGCKAWLAAELLWNPGQDWRALVDEFYRNFFGPAAEPMRQFYELAEERRNTHAGPANWIKFYKDEAGIEHFPPAFCADLRELLERARHAARGDARRSARIEIVSDAFSFTEAYADFHFARRALTLLVLDLPRGKPAEVVSNLDAAMVKCITARKAFFRLARKLIKSPYHSRLAAALDFAQSDPVPLALAARAGLVAGLDPVPPLPEEVTGRRSYREAIAGAERWVNGDAGLPLVVQNPRLRWGDQPPQPQTFLGPPLPEVSGWEIGFRPAPRFAVDPLFGADEDEAQRGVRLSGADGASFYTAVPVRPGQDYYLGMRCAWRVSPDNRSLLQANWYDASGEPLGGSLLFSFPTGEMDSRKLEFPLHARAEAAWLRLGFNLSRQYPEDHLSVEEVELRRIPE